jgi:hypothetical protein
VQAPPSALDDVSPRILDLPRGVVVRRFGVPVTCDDAETTTFWVMQSIRLDLGYGSQVHP